MKFRQVNGVPGLLRFGALALFASFSVFALVYQNCSGTGTSGLGNSNTGSVNTALASKPMPVSFNLNEISYMSCPATFNGNSSFSGDPIGGPFYQLRFGSYNNSSSNGFVTTPTGGTGAPNNVGGLSFPLASMAYMRSVNPNPTSYMLSNYLNTSPYSANSQPVVALVNKTRSSCTGNNCGGLSQDAAGIQLLVPLNNSTLVSDLSSATQITGGGTSPSGYFYNLPSGQNSLAGSLNSSIAGNGTQGLIAAENQFRTELGNLIYLTAGFAPSSDMNAAGIIQNLESPDSNPAQRIFGLGYSLVFGSTNPSDPKSVTSIQEFDLSSSAFSPTQVSGSWQCLNLTIVRDIDRKYWTTTAATSAYSPFLNYLSQQAGVTNSGQMNMPAGTPVHPMDVTSMAGLQMNYLRDTSPSVAYTNGIPYLMYNLMDRYTGYATALGIPAGKYNSSTFGGYVPSLSTVSLYLGYTGTGFYGIEGGNFFACPPEDPSTLIGNPQALQELKIIRRFLAPEYWDVNISQMCAVPKTAAESFGSCYASGDINYNSSIQYDGAPGSSCYDGNGTNTGAPECPAKVSVCWRYQ